MSVSETPSENGLFYREKPTSERRFCRFGVLLGEQRASKTRGQGSNPCAPALGGPLSVTDPHATLLRLKTRFDSWRGHQIPECSRSMTWVPGAKSSCPGFRAGHPGCADHSVGPLGFDPCECVGRTAVFEAARPGSTPGRGTGNAHCDWLSSPLQLKSDSWNQQLSKTTILPTPRVCYPSSESILSPRVTPAAANHASLEAASR